jgi:hypothetical protein
MITRKMDAWFFGLIFECPYKEYDSSCPFHYIRKLPVKERLKIIEENSDEVFTLMVWKHLICFSKKHDSS